MIESYSVEEAFRKSLDWCNSQKGWKRICDIEDIDELYKTWDELSATAQKPWIQQFGQVDARRYWEENAEQPCKVPYGFVTGKGEFYKNVLEVPMRHNLVQVYKVSNES